MTRHLQPDPDALAIGELYRLGRQSMIESVHHLIEAGRRLLEKKVSLGHGDFLPWLEANADVLGFDTPRTAQKLIEASIKYDAGVAFTDQKAIEISRAIWGHNVRGTEGTGENEWFTPAEYIEAARAVMGGIDLDPATSVKAQEVVQAEKFYTKKDDGRKHEWHGRVWLNPPYAQPFIAQFVHKLCEERVAGRVTAAIALTHNYTDTTWFHEILQKR
jgi:DNA N-6-adenine-methyltransferase (Dam)/Protein of unknown function (DUF3102)